MGRAIFILVVFFIPFSGFSQKRVEKTVTNPSTKFIEVDGNKCFHVQLKTHSSNMLKVEASMEGEYAKDLVVKVKEDGNNIRISTDFLPSYSNPNDKLSALKEISIVLSVTLPQYITATVYGTHSNVMAKGSYKKLSITLADGKCVLKNISESVEVKTQKGQILVQGAQGTVHAESEYGTVAKGTIPEGEQTFTLHSVEGDIWINQNNG